MNNKLILALDELNLSLAKDRITINLVICGAFAIELHGFNRIDETLDIDTHSKIENIKQKISDIAEKLGLMENWLNNQVADIQLPKNAVHRLKVIDRWSNIRVSLLSVDDLICMKISAWLNRGHITDKDYNDLVIMKATKNQIEKGIDYVIDSHGINELPEKFKNETMELLDELKTNFKNE